MLAYLFAVLAACANAAASVLQRKANRDLPANENLSFRLVLDVLRQPVWFGGFLGVIAGFLLQAAALSNGALSVVEPILVFELPATLLLAGIVFHRRLHRREWSAALAMTVGLGALLFVLDPRGGSSVGIDWYVWLLGIGVNLAVIAVLVLAARRVRGGPRAALLGIATGCSFGLTAALMKAMTDAFPEGGLVAVLTTWQTYGMIVAGGLAMFLLQSALNAGSLVASQPGITVSDPIVSILWGTVAFGETVRGGWHLAAAVVAAVVIGWGVHHLSRSALVTGDDGAG